MCSALYVGSVNAPSLSAPMATPTAPESSPASLRAAVTSASSTLHPSRSTASTAGLVSPFAAGAATDVEAISALVHAHVPDAELADNSSSELVYLLPSATDDHSAASQYIGLFRELDGTSTTCRSIRVDAARLYS